MACTVSHGKYSAKTYSFNSSALELMVSFKFPLENKILGQLLNSRCSLQTYLSKLQSKGTGRKQQTIVSSSRSRIFHIVRHQLCIRPKIAYPVYGEDNYIQLMHSNDRIMRLNWCFHSRPWPWSTSTIRDATNREERRTYEFSHGLSSTRHRSLMFHDILLERCEQGREI